jgi:HTH domain
MTAPFYTEPQRLDDYFYRLRNRCATDREALDWMRRHIDSGQLVIKPALPAKPYVLRLTKTRDLVIDTNLDLLDPNDPDPPLDAANFQVTIVTDAPPPPIPDEEPYVIIASGRRLIPRGYVLVPPNPPAPPTVEIKATAKAKKHPASKKAKGEGAGNQTEAAVSKRAEKDAARITPRRNKIEAALAKAALANRPRPSAQALAARFHVSLRTIKRDLKHLDDTP